MIKLTWSAGNREPDDPRIEALATEVASLFLAVPSLLPSLTGLQNRDDGGTRHEPLTHHGEDGRPGRTRLTALIQAELREAGRGETGSRGGADVP